MEVTLWMFFSPFFLCANPVLLRLGLGIGILFWHVSDAMLCVRGVIGNSEVFAWKKPPFFSPRGGGKRDK